MNPVTGTIESSIGVTVSVSVRVNITGRVGARDRAGVRVKVTSTGSIRVIFGRSHFKGVSGRVRARRKPQPIHGQRSLCSRPPPGRDMPEVTVWVRHGGVRVRVRYLP